MSVPRSVDDTMSGGGEPEAGDVNPGEAEAEAAEAERPSRRRFFLGAAAAVATATLIPTRAAKAQRIQRPRPAIMTRPGAPSGASADTIVKLVNRVTLGATEDEVKRAKSM